MKKININTESMEDALNKGKETAQQNMMEMLGFAYEKTLTGLPGEKSVYELVDDYLLKHGDKETAIDKLIASQITKAGTSGFLTGLGGVVTLPLAVPANVASVILFQMRMIAAIALMRGYDLKSDQVQTIVYATLAGNTVVDLMKGAGIQFANKMALGVVKKVPGATLTKINQAVGFRLVTKFGTKGVINLGKAVPLAGGVVGGAFDVTTTRMIAKLAKKTFTDHGIDLGDGNILNI